MKIIFVAGIPYSGKSTFIQCLLDKKVVLQGIQDQIEVDSEFEVLEVDRGISEIAKDFSLIFSGLDSWLPKFKTDFEKEHRKSGIHNKEIFVKKIEKEWKDTQGNQREFIRYYGAYKNHLWLLGVISKINNIGDKTIIIDSTMETRKIRSDVFELFRRECPNFSSIQKEFYYFNTPLDECLKRRKANPIRSDKVFQTKAKLIRERYRNQEHPVKFELGDCYIGILG
ncbi:hypothetical protein ABT56_22210 [Photobacterium aquae]|uniref:Uncharacterized protein n=1 Tax=Photobacterium aquae TaxID=1195763 RepID=A0A0J1JHP6_9GAMM|nr:hypothetical protein [Photobacterium aquae]KLV01472.1 hypothetical protein ABT56_22210 [Photobacterium aquae]